MCSFQSSLLIGKEAERQAEKYFNKHGYKFIDVRNNPEYRNIDVDYIVGGLGKVEVKLNFNNARKGKVGWFFWVELEVGKNQGWYYKSKADYFLFFNEYGNGILIKNDDVFKSIVNEGIEIGNHSENGNFRFDHIKDYRKDGYVIAKNMRLYLDCCKDANIQKIVKRKR